MDFRHIHASLLWKVSRANRRRELDHYRERADLVTTTETSGRRDRKAIFGNVPGWQHYRPGGGAGKRQTTITWRSDVFERDGKPHARLLSKTTWKRVGNGSTTPWIWATVVPLKHKATGKRLYAISCHLPSAVEGTDTPEGYTNSTPRRVRAHRESLGSLQDLVHEIQEGEPEAAILLAGDWNMNLRRERVAEWLSKSLAPLGSCWGGRLPTKGTHHRRVIDATYVWGLATGAQRVLKKRHSDHRAYRTKFSLLDLSPEPEPEPEPAPEPEPDVEALVEEIEDALDAAQASLAHAIERLQEIR